jgi:hypothetical protein
VSLKVVALADEIVKQVVKWAFGYFDIEKQEWITFFDLISESAREILPESDRQRVIKS